MLETYFSFHNSYAVDYYLYLVLLKVNMTLCYCECDINVVFHFKLQFCYVLCVQRAFQARGETEFAVRIICKHMSGNAA